MPAPSALIVFILCFCCSLMGCGDDKDQFSGFSEMVAERNEKRRAVTSGSGQKQAIGMPAKVSSSQVKEKSTLAPGILFEREIEILEAQSKIPLAKGVAYLDKRGRIVKIKIIKHY